MPYLTSEVKSSMISAVLNCRLHEKDAVSNLRSERQTRNELIFPNWEPHAKYKIQTVSVAERYPIVVK